MGNILYTIYFNNYTKEAPLRDLEVTQFFLWKNNKSLPLEHMTLIHYHITIIAKTNKASSLQMYESFELGLIFQRIIL